MHMACIIHIFLNAELKIDFSYYQTTKQIEDKLNKFIKQYPKLIKEGSIQNIKELNSPKDSKLKYYDVSNSDASNKNKTKAFLMAGEHPRELISVETMIGFLEELMNNNKKNEQILNDYDLRIVINANPEAREKVEKGEYCRRVNLNNVDINRNWDYNWGKK